MVEKIISYVIYMPQRERLKALEDAERNALVISIPQTEERKQIGELYHNVQDVLRKIFGLKRSGRYLEEIGKLNRIEIYERRNIRDDYKNEMTCAKYIFWTLLNEPWGSYVSYYSDRDLPSAYFWNETTLVLKEKSFRLLQTGEEFKEGDVVVYRGKNGSGEMSREALHFGLVDCDGKVISKFRFMHAYRHAIENIPPHYGDFGVFYRKTKLAPAS